LLEKQEAEIDRERQLQGVRSMRCAARFTLRPKIANTEEEQYKPRRAVEKGVAPIDELPAARAAEYPAPLANNVRLGRIWREAQR